MGPIITLIYPIWIWTCARYHYRPTFNFLMHNIVIVTEPMTYFYSLLIRPGSEIIDGQWKATLCIFNITTMVLVHAVDLGQSPPEDKIFPLFVAVVCGVWTVHFIKTYFYAYVYP